MTPLVMMLRCQSGPGMIPGWGPSGTCSAISGNGSGGSVVSHSYTGRGSGDGIRGLEEVSGVPTTVGGDGVGE